MENSNNDIKTDSSIVVYVLFIEQMMDCEIIRQTTEVYSTLDKAKEALRAFADEEKPWCRESGWTISDTENGFEAHEEGRYSSNHTCAEIHVETVR